MDELVSLVNTYASIPVFIATGYTAFIYRELTKELKVFTAFIFLSGSIELISRILWLSHRNNLPLLHLYVVLGFLCLALFYSSVLKGLISPKIIWGTAILFTFFTLVNSLFIQNIYTFNSYALTVESVLVIIFSLFTFTVLMNDIVKEKRVHFIKSLNWINSGLFIYYTSSLLIFHFGDLFTKQFPVYLNQYTWTFHALFSMVMYSCFFVGLWKRPRHGNSGRVS